MYNLNITIFEVILQAITVLKTSKRNQLTYQSRHTLLLHIHTISDHKKTLTWNKKCHEMKFLEFKFLKSRHQL